MFMNSPRAISSNLDIKYFCGQQNICQPSMSDDRSRLPLCSQTDCEKLTYWSQIVSPPGEIQYPRDISGNHLFRHERGIRRRPQCPGAGCVSIMMAVIHSIGIREAACFTGVKLSKSNILYRDSNLNPQRPFQTIWIWDASLTFNHTSCCWLWPYWKRLKG